VLEGWGAPSDAGDDPLTMRRQEEYIRSVVPEPITHFFSSEWYGAHVSQALGARDVRVDADRRQVPVSATQVRADPYGYRALVHPRVYRDLVKKVVLLGAESTGKTTLAETLAREFHTVWMPEYGREHWERHRDARGKLSLQQLVDLAREHLCREDQRILESDRFLFVDTNAVTTAMFSRFYHGAVHPELMSLARQAETRYDYVFVCADDFPYHEDGTRSGAEHRTRFQQQILADLNRRGLAYSLLEGPLEARIDSVRKALCYRW
jgi:NadR type nicotinamide-nucleotide adenylyltransferase